MIFELKREHFEILSMFRIIQKKHVESQDSNYYIYLKGRKDILISLWKMNLNKEQMILFSQIYNKKFNRDMRSIEFHDMLIETFRIVLQIFFNIYKEIPSLGKYKISYQEKNGILARSHSEFIQINKKEYNKNSFINEMSSQVDNLDYKMENVSVVLYKRNGVDINDFEKLEIMFMDQDSKNDIKKYNNQIESLAESITPVSSGKI